MRKILFLALIFLSYNCSNHSEKNQKPLIHMESFPIKPMVIISEDEEGGGADIRLSITSVSENDTATIYQVVSSWHNKNLGLSLAIPKKEGEKGFGNGMELKSLGEESDYLLIALANLYGEKPDSAVHFKTSITVNYVNLGGFAKTLGAKDESDTSLAEYKLFFEGKQKDEYAELYLNVNPSGKLIELREKDSEYRPAIINFLKN
jgi:hypothetical protein